MRLDLLGLRLQQRMHKLSKPHLSVLLRLLLLLVPLLVVLWMLVLGLVRPDIRVPLFVRELELMGDMVNMEQRLRNRHAHTLAHLSGALKLLSRLQREQHTNRHVPLDWRVHFLGILVALVYNLRQQHGRDPHVLSILRCLVSQLPRQ